MNKLSAVQVKSFSGGGIYMLKMFYTLPNVDLYIFQLKVL